jgi:hypothetical protein
MSDTRTAYLIDSANRVVNQVTFDGLAGLQALIGGYLEVARTWPCGDVLYVDEDGLRKDLPFFWLHGVRNVIAGNGVVVGREVEGDEYPGGFTTLPPVTPLEDLQAAVRFLGRRGV